MRLLLTLLPLTSLAAPVLAQDLDLYQAALDHTPLDAIRPALEAAYPGLVDVSAQIDPSFMAAGVTLLYDNHAATPSAFLFCQGAFSGFAAVIPPAQAAGIIETLTVPEFPVTETYASGDGVTLRYPEADVSLQYWGIGTPDSYVLVNYPISTFTVMNFAARCESVAANR